MECYSTKALTVVPELKHKIDIFYQRKFSFSYSSLNKLLGDPATFFQEYVLGKRKKKTDKHFIEGKAIHALLLHEDKFDLNFIVTPTDLPSENTRFVLDQIFETCKPAEDGGKTIIPDPKEYRDKILSLLLDMGLHQSLADDKPDKQGVIAKTGDDKRVEKILSKEALSYWQYLHVTGERDILDTQSLEHCGRAVATVKDNPEVMELLGMSYTEFEDVEVYNELELRYDLKKYPFGLKGFIDNLVVHHGLKVIRINDIKTSSKELREWTEAIELYNYWLQGAIYILLVLKNYHELIARGYKVEFNFVVIDKNLNVYPFPVKKETMNQWLERFYHESLFKANYHYTQKQYKLPYEFAERLVAL